MAFDGVADLVRKQEEHAKYQRAYYQKHREKKLAYARAYHASNRGRINDKRRKTNRTRGPNGSHDPKKYNYRYFISVYGITVEDYERMLIEQNGVCAICSKPPAKKRLHIDHNHQTGKVRGLLCNSCNASLGGFRDDVAILENAKKYLLERS